jgi:hypothetical protein
MSQHDLNVANQGFPATRADLNNALAALASNSSGPSEPSTTYANQLWYDTSNDLLKFRNEADSVWIDLAYMNQTTSEWEIRSGVVQAVDSDGILFKTDEGTTRATLGDDGNWTFTGTVASANISDGTDTVATGFVVNGTAKATSVYNQLTDTTEFSFNISSFTDVGTGNLYHNLTNTLTSSNQVTNASNSHAGGWPGVYARGTSSTFVRTVSRSSLSTNADAIISMVCHGDLA